MKYLHVLRYALIIMLIPLMISLLVSLHTKLDAQTPQNTLEATYHKAPAMVLMDADGIIGERSSNSAANSHSMSHDPIGVDSRATDDASSVLPNHRFQVLDELQQYAQACDQAIGVTVPDFSCDAGTEVTEDHLTPSNAVYPNGDCDRPNQLNQKCDPGSRFQVLTNSADAYIVAHCRKKGGLTGKYGDIAVIQYNRHNGATCFYQSPVTSNTLDGNVNAPSKGLSAWAWLSPANTASIGCAGCHDNGPLIRSPYLTQITGSNALPGAGDNAFNHAQPYYFVGAAFANWKAYKVEIAGNKCNECHRMGVSNIGDGGTARDFGIRATSPYTANPHKNRDSAASPFWMLRSQTAYSPENATAAQAIRACALRWSENPLPNSDACKITLFTGASCNANSDLYVDSAYTGAQQGSATKPFKTVYSAGRAACAGAELHIKSGTYFEALTISKPLRLVAENGTARLFGSGSTNVTVAPDTPTAITSNDGNATVQIPANSGINTVNVGTIAIDLGGATLPSGSAPRSPIYDVTASDQTNQPITTLPGQIAIAIAYADGSVTAAGIVAETDLNVYRRTRNDDGSYTTWTSMLPCSGCTQDTTANQFMVQTNQLGQFTVLEAVAGMRIAPPALNFTMVQNGANPTAQTLTIEKEGTGTLEWSTIEVLPWLSLWPEAGSEPASIQISVDAGSLAAGIYAGTIYIVQGAREIAIPVMLTMQAGNAIPTSSQIYLPLVVR